MHYISGLNVDDELSWKDHIDQVACNKNIENDSNYGKGETLSIYPNVIKDNL